jgi:putative transposase
VARKPRENEVGGIYHVFARGNNRGRIYLDDTDRQFYLWRLELIVGQLRWRVLSYCLMDNHVHLLVETPEANLSEGMRLLHGGYAQTFNVRHDRVGHVFQGRYGATPMRSDAQVCAAAAYIARNPVTASLCDEPEQWRWSSLGPVIAESEPDWLDAHRLLRFFASRPQIARRRYAEMSRRWGQTPLVGEPQGV